MDCWTGGLDCGNAGRGPLGRGMVETEREKMCIRRQTRDCRTGEGKKGRKFFFVSFFISVSLFDSFQHEMRTKSECGVGVSRSFAFVLCFSFLGGKVKVFPLTLRVLCVCIRVCVRAAYLLLPVRGGGEHTEQNQEKKN